MPDSETLRRIDTARDILVGKVPDPKSQVEQITIALIYKFMDDMDQDSIARGGSPSFFTGEYARYAWSSIFNPRLGGQEMLNLYADAITQMTYNTNLPALFRSIFKNAFLPYRDPETLKLFLKTINEFRYEHSEDLGDAFEYLLSIMSSQGEAGQFRTPRHIIDFMVRVVQPQAHETILDPACGTAGFLISAYKYILAANQNQRPGDRLTPLQRTRLLDNFTGYDISPDMVRLSLVNLYLHGFTREDIHISEYDTLTSIEHWGEHFDVILANPPFMSPKGGIRPHTRFSVQSNRSEVLFVDYIAEHLTANGRAGVIVPEGIVFQSGKAYTKLRDMLIKKYLIGVISLPSGVFMPYTGVKTSILIMDREIAARNPNILFSEVKEIGFSLGIKRTPTNHNQLPIIENDYRAYYNGGEFSKHSWLVPRKDILANNTYLVGTRYKPEIVTSEKTFVKIADVCILTKGTFSSTTTPPGQYPLILTAAEPKTSQDYQFEGEAVCVPLISSTGHGKATLNRIHFANGRFALANLLVALQPKNDAEINTKYLYYALDAKKPDIASLMRGAANVSMKPEDLAQFQIPLPPLDVQRQIVDEIAGYQRIIDGARQVVENWKPQIESELAACLPDGLEAWPIVSLGNKSLFVIESGGTPSSKDAHYWNGSIPWATLVDLPQNDHISIIRDTERKITENGLHNSSAKLLPPDSIIVSSRATIGRIGINTLPLATNQGFKNIILQDFKVTEPFFIAYWVKTLVPKMNDLASGGTFKEISKTLFSTLEIPLPPLDVQREIVARIERERAIVEANRELIEIYQQKITAAVNRVWESA